MSLPASSPSPAMPVRKVGRRCKVCHHARLAEIDAALIRGDGFKAIAINFDVSEQSVARHHSSHLPIAARQEAAEAVADAEGDRASGLLGDASNLLQRALAILKKAEDAGTLSVALQGIRECARCIELQAKLTGEIDESIHLNIAYAPALIQLRTAVMFALLDFPEAKQRVVAALTDLDGSGSAPLTIEHQPAK